MIVTTGINWTDIDCLACVIAYAEYSGAIPVIYGKFNASIPKSILDMDFKYLTKIPRGNHEFVICDVSDPEQFQKVVPLDKIVKVYDHHLGFEKLWGSRGQIERVGACATQIFELFNRPPSTITANLLYTAIFSNSLNFQASVTTQRDIDAANKLKQFINLPSDYIEKYYQETAAEILKNPVSSLLLDTKIINGLNIGQIESWFAPDIIKTIINATKTAYKGEWIISFPSISENKTYFVTNSDMVRTRLPVKFNGDTGVVSKLILRKEYINKLR